MDNKLKPCPFCGAELFGGLNMRHKPVRRHPNYSGCPLSDAWWTDTPGFREIWNHRRGVMIDGQ